MDKRIYLLTIVSFVVGMVELMIGGLIDILAEDLQISLSQAGLLITVFSVVFGISAPLLLIATARFERKKLTLITLAVFLVGNTLAVVSPTYSVLFISRILSAASASLLIVLCITMAAAIADKEHRGRAIGIVFMGVSGSLVFGVPLGLLVGNSFGWRAPFLLISILTCLSIAGVYYLMEKVEPKPPVSIRKQLRTLKSGKIVLAHTTTFLFLAGHLTLYGYFTPFLRTTIGADSMMVSIMYFVFGISAVAGGGIGGALADRFGPKPIILAITLVFAGCLFTIPLTTHLLPLFIIIVMIWGALSWAVTPAIQSFLIDTSPDTSDIQQSLNNSALHFGIAFGSFIGSIAIQHNVTLNPIIGGLFIMIALGTASASIVLKDKSTLPTLEQ